MLKAFGGVNFRVDRTSDWNAWCFISKRFQLTASGITSDARPFLSNWTQHGCWLRGWYGISEVLECSVIEAMVRLWDKRLGIWCLKWCHSCFDSFILSKSASCFLVFYVLFHWKVGKFEETGLTALYGRELYFSSSTVSCTVLDWQ